MPRLIVNLNDVVRTAFTKPTQLQQKVGEYLSGPEGPSLGAVSGTAAQAALSPFIGLVPAHNVGVEVKEKIDNGLEEIRNQQQKVQFPGAQPA